MKNLWSFLTFLIMFSSCSGDDDQLIPGELPLEGKWDLVHTSGQVAGFEATGEDLPFQEFYIFRADGTFYKQRITGGETLEASGQFELGTSEFTLDGETAVKSVILSYPVETPILSTCHHALIEEHYYFPENGRLVNTWRACDGLGMEYVKTQ